MLEAVPVLLDIMYHLHESTYWAMLDFSWLFERQLESGTELLPKGWTAFAPGSGGAHGEQGFGDCPEVCSPSLRSPGVLLQNVLLGFG